MDRVDSRSITNEDGKSIEDRSNRSARFSIDLDYQLCIEQARSIINDEKQIICPDYRFVCHAELEIHLNSILTNLADRWLLYFQEISLPPGWNSHVTYSQPIQVFDYPPDKLIIYQNSKMKYSCANCNYQWASARGRMIIQSEYPRMNKYNFLYLHLYPQQCRYCRREIPPCWYLDEATRVMKNVCRILLERFYSNRILNIEALVFNEEQRRSYARGPHEENLCSACRIQCCFDSHR